MIFNRLGRKQILLITVIGVLVVVAFVCLYANAGQPEHGRRQLTCNVSASVDVGNSTLELVHIVLRHGARTPVNTYPTDPYASGDFRPIGWGHVTNQGKLELYRLGEWLRQRYGAFLQPYYMPDMVHAQATASPRALMSMATVLASLFPPIGTAMEWQHKFNWQPIPIQSEPLDQDSLLLVRTPCPRYFEALDEVLQSEAIENDLAPYKAMLENLTALTGMPVRTADDVNSLYITLLAEQEFGLPLPAWTADYFPAKMEYLAAQSYVHNAYTPEMQKIKGGPFLKKMLDEMLAKRAQALRPTARKLYIYTGHDWTVGNILSALKVWPRQMPIFAVTTMFELHRNQQSGDYYVEIFLRNDRHGCLTRLQIPGCDLKCPLDRLIALVRDVLPLDTYEERCKARNREYQPPAERTVDRNS